MRARARELRACGHTYLEIAAELCVSKGSVSLWVRDRPRPGRLSEEEWRARNSAAVSAYWQGEGLRREAARQAMSREAARQIGALSDRELLIADENADIAAAGEFWRGVTELPAEQFRKPSLKRQNPKTVRKNTGADYHVCLIIYVRRGIELYRRIEGWALACVETGQGFEPDNNQLCG